MKNTERFRILFLSSVIIALYVAPDAVFGGTAEAEKIIGTSDCVACHTLNDKLVGPAYSEIAKKYVNDKGALNLLSKKVKEGGAGTWGDIPMTPHPALSDNDVTTVVEWILSLEASSQPAIATEKKQPAVEYSQEEAAIGRKLFQGIQRLEKDGPSCIACHDVKNDAIIGGGILAKELTTVFSRMGAGGVKAILGRPPFPVMNRAYKDKALSPDEIRSLIAFLHQADKEHALQQPRDYGVKLAMTGVAGVLILLAFYALAFSRRRRKLVNQEIFDRQIKSQDDLS